MLLTLGGVAEDLEGTIHIVDGLVKNAMIQCDQSYIKRSDESNLEWKAAYTTLFKCLQTLKGIK